MDRVAVGIAVRVGRLLVGVGGGLVVGVVGAEVGETVGVPFVDRGDAGWVRVRAAAVSALAQPIPPTTTAVAASAPTRTLTRPISRRRTCAACRQTTGADQEFAGNPLWSRLRRANR